MTSLKREVIKNQSFHLLNLIVMKLLCLIFTVSIMSTIVKGEIKNGYADVRNAHTALMILLSSGSSNTNVSARQSRKVNDRIKVLTDYINYFEATENLLQQFRIIAPELYNEMDSIKDKNGKITDVYVKFIPKEQTDVQHPGTTYIIHNEGDETCYSEYGAQTVSIKIWIMDTSLTILAHELGHVKYEVPNLAAYDKYHKQNYRSLNTEPNYIGHSQSDRSGKSATIFEKEFSENYRSYLRTSIVKVSSPFKVMSEIRRTKKNLLSVAAKEEL